MRKQSWFAVLLAVMSCSGETDPEPSPPAPTPDIHTPRWAFEPWISKDISDGPDTQNFVSGFIDRDIPVGVVVLDSPWETDYNTFVPNPSRYPEFETMVTDLRAQDVRIVLWVTQMLNEESFDAEEGGDTYDSPSLTYLKAKRDGYFVNEGETFFWWKGKGAGIDFFNEDALAYWHELQDDLLDLGINGWKLDFGESYLEVDTLRTAMGPVPHQVYSEEYYRDFWAYGVSKVGIDEFVTMVRPYDKSYHFEGRFFARPEHAPVAWVGDNRRDFVGLIDALDHMFRSAQAGYVMLGSDVGGYLDRDDTNLLSLVPYDGEVFQRWIALGAMTPFMQLHGRANLEPWSVPDAAEVVPTYRYWAQLHHELVPFFYSLAQNAYAEGGTILKPIGADESVWMDDWRFWVGDAFLVAPIIDATGVRDVPLPGTTNWRDWWTGAVFDGGTTITNYDVGDVARIPLFLAEGAIVPMTVSSTVTGIGNEAFGDHLTVLVQPGADATFVLHDFDDSKTELFIEGTDIGISRRLKPTVFVVHGGAPSNVVIDGAAANALADLAAVASTSSGWWHDADGRRTYVKVPTGDAARITLQ